MADSTECLHRSDVSAYNSGADLGKKTWESCFFLCEDVENRTEIETQHATALSRQRSRMRAREPVPPAKRVGGAGHPARHRQDRGLRGRDNRCSAESRQPMRVSPGPVTDKENPPRPSAFQARSKHGRDARGSCSPPQLLISRVSSSVVLSYCGFHSGTCPGVQGAPAFSMSSSSFFRSTSTNCRSLDS